MFCFNIYPLTEYGGCIAFFYSKRKNIKT